jgi:hypothetical protein
LQAPCGNAAAVDPPIKTGSVATLTLLLLGTRVQVNWLDVTQLRKGLDEVVSTFSIYLLLPMLEDASVTEDMRSARPHRKRVGRLDRGEA